MLLRSICGVSKERDERHLVDYFKILSIALLCVSTWSAGPARAQQVTGDIVGTVADATGGVIPNANIQVKNLGTEETRVAKSNEQGEFTFTLLQPGQYSVAVDAAGFKSFVQSGIDLAVGARYRVSAQLEVGQASEKIVVTTEAAALQTDDSTLQAVVESKAVEDLPLNGRNFVQLAQIVPGANEGPSHSAASGGGGSDYRPSSALVVNGQSDVQNNYMLDGTDNNERLLGLLGVRTSVDAIAEVNVMTGQYTAELGRTSGGVVNIITKSGTDEFHGSVYEFLRNDDLDAKDYFALSGTKPPLKQNQFGGSFGGPIRKSKTFFFADFEGFRQVLGQPKLLTIPTLQEETNLDFTDVGGGVLNKATLNPIALQYFSLYPAPNLSGIANNYVAASVQRQNSETFDVRVDQHINDNNNIFGRYSYNNTHTVNPGGLPAVNGIVPDGGITAPELVQNAMGNFTHIFNPSLLLELKAAYTRIDLDTTLANNGKNLSTQFGLAGANIDSTTSGLTLMQPAGYEPLGDASFNPDTTFDSTLQFMGALSYTKGKHSMKFGAAYIHSGADQFQNRWGLGWYMFVPAPPFFNSMINFLNGVPFQLTRANLLQTQDLRTSEPNVYAQDNWRVTPKLTLTYGVRYGVFTPYTEAHNGIDSFDPATATLLVAGKNGVGPTAGVTTDYLDFAPRVGIAWTPRNGTAVRAGYGRSYYPDNTGGGIYLKNQPFEYFYQSAPFSVTLSQPMPTPSVLPTDQADLTGALSGVDKDFKASYADQFSLNVQHEIQKFVATLGYVGVTTHRQAMDLQINQAPPAPCPNVPGPPCYYANQPYYAQVPNVTGGISYQVTHGVSNYNGFQATVQRQYSSGLMLNANYTVAHSLSDVLSFTGRALSEGWGEVPQNLGWYNVWKQVHAREYSNSDFDIRHRIALQLAYEVPFGKNLKGVEGTLVKGWHTNGILVWQTGEPFTVIDNSPVSNTNINPPNNGDRPNWTGKWKVSNPGISEWFDTTAFTTQAGGTLGDEPRNMLYGPHFRHFDFSLGKEFALAETKSLQFRMENFNLSNTPNFDLPNAQMGNGNFGTISATRFAPRQIQLALKLLF
jgi:outer membrane receptor protein involved in Fe transport